MPPYVYDPLALNWALDYSSKMFIVDSISIGMGFSCKFILLGSHEGLTFSLKSIFTERFAIWSEQVNY